MKMVILPITCILITIGCSSCGIFGSSSNKAKIILNKNGSIVLNDGKIVNVKEGVEADLPEGSFVAKSPGMVPVYVVPLMSNFRKIDIKFISLGSDDLSSYYNDQFENNLSKALFDIHEIQNLIYNKRFIQALSLIDKSEKKFGNLAFLEYMKASVFYLKGDKRSAKALLEKMVANGNKDEQIARFLKEM